MKKINILVFNILLLFLAVILIKTVQAEPIGYVHSALMFNSVANKTVDEGKPLIFTISATAGASEDIYLSYSATNLPTGANFSDSTFSWIPGYDQAGTYNVNFSVNDGVETKQKVLTITVNNVDRSNPCAGKTNCIEVDSCRILDQTGAYYVLTQDVSADNSCFYIDADNIVLDLNGYTITYANNGSNVDCYYEPDGWVYGANACHYGVFVSDYPSENPDSLSSDWNKHSDNTEIKNGTIRQGNSNTRWGDAIHIYGNHNSYHDLNIEVKGPDSRAIWSRMAQNNNQDVDVDVYNNIVYMNLIDITNRYTVPSVFWIGNGSRIYNNHITGRGQAGIKVGDNSQVHDNYISMWGIAPNAYAIIMGSYSEIYNNYVNQLNGRATGMGSDNNTEGGHHIQFYNNHFEGREGCDANATDITHVFRVRYGSHDNEIHDNDIIAYGAKDCYKNAIALRVSEDPVYYGGKNHIYNNTIAAFTNSDNDSYVVAFMLEGDDDNREYPNDSIHDNRIISNSQNMVYGGSNGGLSGTVLTSNTFVKADNTADYTNSGAYYTLNVGFYGYPSYDQVLLDSKFENGASYSQVIFNGSDPEMVVKWYLDIKALGANALALPGANITIKDVFGNTVSQGGVTDSSGHFKKDLTEFVQVSGTNKTYYSPYTVIVSYAGETKTRQVTLNASKEESFSFGSGVIDNPPADNNPPADDSSNTPSSGSSTTPTPDTNTPSSGNSTTPISETNNNSNIGNVAIDTQLTNRLKGRILLQVESLGEAWYVKPSDGQRVYMKDGDAAYQIMRFLSLGITNANLNKIPIGIEDRFEEFDADGDGLSDKIEEAIGSNLFNKDSDGDGFDDKSEVLNNFSPISSSRVALLRDNSLINRLKGQILLQVESRGEAWYVNPVDGKRYYMKDGDAAYQIMRFLSLGITNADLAKIAQD